MSIVLLLAALVIAVIRLSDDGDSSRAAPSTSTTPAISVPPAVTPDASGEPNYIRDIKAQVSELRGLPWKAPLTVQVVSKSELARRIKEVVDRDANPERISGDEATLKALHLIPRDLDYRKAIDDLLAEQVLGFYDPVTKAMMVADAGDGDVSPDTKVTIAHELDHALTDQHFDFGSKTDALDNDDRGEEYAAFGALIEGDAVSLQLLWAEAHLSADEQAEALLGSGADTSVFARTPPFIRASLLFPYTAGAEFVADLIDGTSFKRVDEAYNRPPTSTEQILDSELYSPAEDWSSPAITDAAVPSGCAALRKNTLGEFVMRELLNAHLGTSESNRGAKGWDGDTFQTVRCGSALGVVDKWRADSDDDAARLEAALNKWVAGWSGSGRAPEPDGHFSGPDGAGRITRSGSQVQIVLADDVPTADRLETAVGVLN
ncbi:MAG TPA: hypothetical protein VM121_04800 [Acidimicrobiales bacterium]|nr:hypothetical protein [Acidimicrobiales bacterium]